MSGLLLLRAVPTAGLLALAHALGIKRATDDLVADSGQVAHPATPDQHDRVLLEVVPLAGDVGGDLDVAGEAHPGDLAQGRVRLSWRGRVDASADPAALRAALQRRGVDLCDLVPAALPDKLLDRWHRVSIFSAAASSASSGAFLLTAARV